MLEEFNFFVGRIERVVIQRYHSLFSIAEIETSRVLQWAFGATLFSFFLTFNNWFYQTATTVDAFQDGSYTCWPYFQGCGRLLFLRTLPYGYSQPLLYMLLLGTLVVAAYLMYRKKWTGAHLALIPSFLWHAFVCFVLTASISGNYDYYIFFLTLILLFFPHKEFFLKCGLVFFYVLSTVAKIHETWILGTYFSALKTGLPLFPRWSIPIWTNFVIFMEMVGSWFLMSRRVLLQRTVLAFFIIFHLYSGLLVGYRYPATVLPMLIILFGPLYAYTLAPFTRRAIFGWVLIALMCCMQFIPRLIPGDEKLTMEGNRFGLYMFEANHQCVSIVHVNKNDGSTEYRKESYSARQRCDPYEYWFRIHTICVRDPDIMSVAWTFDHSIDGGPFLRIVDVPDACTLSYQPFARNTWIKTEYDHPAVEGYPLENLYD